MNSFDEKLIMKHLPKDKWENAFLKLKEGYPVQYLIGDVDFYDLKIKVSEDVLIPRFETEYLVDDLIALIKKYHFNKGEILDIGTGSGCISIAIGKNTNLKVSAIDISEKALNVAKENAALNDVNINFIHSSIENYTSDTLYDVIVSNPPYVPFSSLVDPKTKYEPQSAIFASDNGLYFYEQIFQKSHNLLKQKFIMAFEIGDNQAKFIQDLCKEHYPHAKCIAKNDLNGFNRYIYIINE